MTRWLPAAPRWLDEAAARVIRALGLDWWFDQRFGSWVDDLLDQLDADVVAGLRRAVPLSSLPAPPRRPALPWRLPNARKDLVVTPRRTTATRVVQVQRQALERLRTHYRRVADRLVAEGKLDLAAYTLAELLDLVDEAILVLERHRRFELAAEIAEAKGVDPARIVRLWYLAGKRENAASVARRCGCWAEAAALATGADREAIAAMWSDDLASRGELPTAVDVAWQHDRREACRPWIRALLDTDEAGRFLPRWSALGERADALERVRAALGDDPGAGRGLWRRPDAWPREVDPALARLALRGAVAASVDPRMVAALVSHADDPVLVEDVRRLPVIPTARVPSHLSLDLEQGSAPILDLAPCGAGVLLAYGEAGVNWIDASGAVRWRSPAPAHRLVSGPDGTALAAARRGSWWSFHRIELHHRRTRHWIDVELDDFADRFSGGMFLVVRPRELLALDPAQSNPRYYWRFPFEDAPPGGTGSQCPRLLVREESFYAWYAKEHYTWRARDRRLQYRREATPPEESELDSLGSWRITRQGDEALVARASARASIRARTPAGHLCGRLSEDAAWIAARGGLGRFDLETGSWWTVAPPSHWR